MVTVKAMKKTVKKAVKKGEGREERVKNMAKEV
jgi:hypothetical protein